MRKSNWAKLKWPRVKETASPAPLWLFCDPFCKSRAQSTCEGELIQKKTQVATIFQCTETHQTFRSRLWVLTKLVSVSETNPNKKQILKRAMLVYRPQVKRGKYLICPIENVYLFQNAAIFFVDPENRGGISFLSLPSSHNRQAVAIHR